MSEQIKNINPWAEKLQQISIPPVEEQWLAMEALLDIEMPVSKKKRRFFFWMFLSTLFSAALLFGVQQLRRVEQKGNLLSNNQSGDNNDKVRSDKGNSSIKQNDSATLHTHNKTASESAREKLDSSKASIAISDMKSNDEKKKIAKKENNFSGPVASSVAKKITSANNNKKNKDKDFKIENEKIKTNNTIAAAINENHKIKKTYRNLPSVIHNLSKSRIGGDILNEKQNVNTSSQKTKSNFEKRTSKINANNKEINPEIANSKNPDKKTEIVNQDNNNSETNSVISIVQDNSSEIKKDSSGKESVAFHSDSAQKIKSADSLSKQEVANKKTDSVHKKKLKGIGFAAGIGFNQSFAIAGQQQSNLNANGTILTDYIPVPMFRMYFNKKMYVEIEVQINSPQYTKNVIAKSQPTINSSGSSVVTTQDSGTINKLYYLNVPISVHYSPFKNFYIGAGLQFSLLNNGVGSFYSTRDSSTNGYSTFLLTSYKTDNLKSSSIFDELKKNEWRFLFDANYQWKNLVLGVRYNQAFSNFINVQISSTQVTQARNSSIQLYLRYILWKNKKAKELLSK